MAQVTIYLPEELESKIKKTAASLDLSLSKFITTVLEQKIRDEWSEESRRLAGAWKDFPTLEEIRETQAEDVRREAF